MTMAKNIVAVYGYTDRFGRVLYEIVRYEPKDFRARRPDGNGGFIWDLNGIERVPFNLPILIGSPPEMVCVCEGEKDVLTLQMFGFVGTTVAGGCGGGQWTPELVRYLEGRDVSVFCDNDPSGLDYADRTCAALYRTAKSLRIVWLPGPPKSDISDWFEDHHTPRELQEIISQTPPWEPPATSITARDNSDWREPKDLRPELPAVPTFALDNLPEAFRGLVEEVSEGMQVPFDFAACATIASLAGSIGHRAVVQPKKLDTSWTLTCNLWGMNIGNPGLMKSPILQLITKPLESIQREWNEIQEADEAVHQKLEEQIKLEKEVYASQYKAAFKDGKPLPPEPDFTLWKPGERRLVISDCTFEALHQIQSANAAGVYQVRDELVGFFCGLERDGREGERQYWLTAWNGDGGFTVDRIGRGTIYVPYVCASLFGNAVPARVRFYLTSVLSGAPGDDGFLPRFQVMCWPDSPRTWKYIDRVNSKAAANAAEQVYRSLVRLSGKNPLRLQFNAESQELFIGWLTNLEARVRSDTTNPVMASHIFKYKKLMPVLAGIFELADCARRGELETKVTPEQNYLTYARRIRLEEPPPVELSEATPIHAINTQRAISLCDYFEAHAERVYSCIITPEIRASHALARHIKKGDLNSPFSSRDISRPCWVDLNTVELIDAALEHLADLGWIRPVEMPPSPKGGRPSERWEINPKIFKK
jgi:putative DNA primase/helicase